MVWFHWLGLIPYGFTAWLLLGRGSPWKSPYHRLAFTLPLAFALAVVLPLLVSKLVPNFVLCYWIAAALCLGGGAALWTSRGLAPPPAWKIHLGWLRILAILWLTFLTVLVAILALKYSFHDQLRTQAHPAVIASAVRGNYPPHLQSFPNIPLKYHFGSDMLAAALAYAFGLQAFRAVDAIQIAGWIAAVAGIYAFCRERNLSPGLSYLAIHWLLLAAGWAYLLRPWLGTLASEPTWPDNYVVFGKFLNPGVISYFFQTPYCAGLSVFFLALALIFRAAAHDSRPNLALAIFGLGSLSIFQFSLFFSTCLSLGLLWTYRFFRTGQSWRAFAQESAAIFLGVVGLAFLLGGFLSGSPSYSKGLLVFNWPPGYLSHAIQAGRQNLTLAQTLLWYFSTLGSLVILFPVALVRGARSAWKKPDFEAVFFGVFAASCLLLPQFFHYRLSWDIIKWFTGFQLATILLILLGFGREAPKSWVLGALLLLCLLDIMPSLNFLKGLSIQPPGQWSEQQKRWLRTLSPRPSPGFSNLLEKIKQSPWTDMVFTTERGADSISYFSGQAMANIDYNTEAFGVLPAILSERRKLLQGLLSDFDLNAMQASPIRWLVFSCADYESRFSEVSRKKIEALVNDGRLWEVRIPARECWRVFRYPAPDGNTTQY